jgi:hypothetical protein
MNRRDVPVGVGCDLALVGSPPSSDSGSLVLSDPTSTLHDPTAGRAVAVARRGTTPAAVADRRGWWTLTRDARVARGTNRWIPVNDVRKCHGEGLRRLVDDRGTRWALTDGAWHLRRPRRGAFP